MILGFATFCSVGMFSAVSNLGAGYVETGRLGDAACRLALRLATDGVH